MLFRGPCIVAFACICVFQDAKKSDAGGNEFDKFRADVAASDTVLDPSLKGAHHQ